MSVYFYWDTWYIIDPKKLVNISIQKILYSTLESKLEEIKRKLSIEIAKKIESSINIFPLIFATTNFLLQKLIAEET